MLTTLGQARSSALRNISGACVNSPEFLSLLNEATRRLMRRGDWVGTVVRIQVCAYRGCLTFPRYVGKIRKVNLCNSPLTMRNLWWDFLSYDVKLNNVCSGTSCVSECNMIYTGKSPVFDDVRGDGRLIRAYARCQADYGKTLTVFGVDENNQDLMTQNVDGTWSQGATITMGNPFGSTAVFVRRIDRILKDETQCPVDVFAYYAATDSLEPVGYYEPSETNPDYERYKLSIPNCACTANVSSDDCGCKHSIEALVKLRFIEAKVDSDLVLIENLDALKDMMQSIKFREAGDSKTANEFEQSAIRELNLDIADQNTEDNISVSNEPFRGSGVGIQRLW